MLVGIIFFTTCDRNQATKFADKSLPSHKNVVRANKVSKLMWLHSTTNFACFSYQVCEICFGYFSRCSSIGPRCGAAAPAPAVAPTTKPTCGVWASWVMGTLKGGPHLLPEVIPGCSLAPVTSMPRWTTLPRSTVRGDWAKTSQITSACFTPLSSERVDKVQQGELFQGLATNSRFFLFSVFFL